MNDQLVNVEKLSRFWHNISSMTSISGYYNINLLDNADWGYSLINQRQHSGSVAANKYCIDRWYNGGTSAGSVTPVAGSHVTLTNGTILMQKMEKISDYFLGKTMTFAYQDNNNNIYSAQLTFPSILSEAVSSETVVGSLTVEIGFQILSSATKIYDIDRTDLPYVKITANADINIRRIWLEFGSVCHLATTPPINYSLNLYICSRHCFRLTSRAWAHVGWGIATSTTTLFSYIPLKNQLRSISPTIERGTGDKVVKLYCNQSATLPLTLTAGNVSIDSTLAFIIFNISSQQTNGSASATLTQGNAYDIDARNEAPVLILSADLP